AVAGPVLSVMILGTAWNGIMNVPYALQLATGQTRLALRINLLLVCLMVPSVLILVRVAGVMGGAAAWLLINLVFVGLGVPLTHHAILPGETRRWWTKDVLPAVITAAAITLLIRYGLPRLEGRAAIVAVVAGTALLSCLTVAMVTFGPGPL